MVEDNLILIQEKCSIIFICQHIELLFFFLNVCIQSQAHKYTPTQYSEVSENNIIIIIEERHKYKTGQVSPIFISYKKSKTYFCFKNTIIKNTEMDMRRESIWL